MRKQITAIGRIRLTGHNRKVDSKGQGRKLRKSLRESCGGLRYTHRVIAAFQGRIENIITATDIFILLYLG